MADNVNPEAIRFTNESARRFADAMAEAVVTAREFVSRYNAAAGDTIFPATTDNVADGAASDGRHIVTNNMVRGLKTGAADQILTWAAVTIAGLPGTPTRETVLRWFAERATSRI